MNKIVKKFAFEKCNIDGVYKISSFKSDDNRGSFIKDFSSKEFKLNNIHFEIKENFYTISSKGVIRANHFQVIKNQRKIIRVIKGKVWDVVVDMRPNSPTFKKWEGFYLDEKDPISLYIPEGVSHGYLVLKKSIVSYKCDELFYPEYDSGFIWNDSTIGIKWPLDLVNNKIILSSKDKNLLTFEEINKKEYF